MGKLYEVVRFRENGTQRVQKRNLTLKQAQDWCNDPETSSMTASSPRGCHGSQKLIDKWHEQNKHWFDGFREQ